MKNVLLAGILGLALLGGGRLSAHEAPEESRLEGRFRDLVAGGEGGGQLQDGIVRELLHGAGHHPSADGAPDWFRGSYSGGFRAGAGVAAGGGGSGRGRGVLGRSRWLDGWGDAFVWRLVGGLTGGMWLGVVPPGGAPQAVPPPGNAALMSVSFGAFKPKVRTYWDAGTFFVESDNMPDGMPDKMVGITAWQQQIPLPTSYFASTPNPDTDTGSIGYGQPNYWRLPLVPVPSAAPIPISSGNFQRGAVALAANGIAIFNPANNRGDVAYEIGELDYYGGHCGLADDYHYHIIPTHLLSAFGGVLGNDKPVAWSLDGYPIYGYLEPDGSARQALDADGGHDIGNGWGYHYHAMGTTATDATHPYGTPQSPYLMRAFHGTVVNYGGQVDGQAEVKAIRASGTGGYEAKVVAGAMFVANAYKNPVALVADGSGHLSEDTTPGAAASPDNFRLRVTIAGVSYDQCWRINRGGVAKTLTITWRLPTGTTTNTYNNNGNRLTAYPMAAPTLAKLPDTGQVADTTSTFGEDADYTVNPPSFTDNGNGTVTDNVTGLMWQKVDSGECTWESAVANAGQVATGGYTDWRLPTPAELFSLFVYAGNPALNATYFPAGAAEYWWTSDVYGASTTNVWCANKGGGLGGKPKSETISAGGAFAYHARYVRGPKPSSTHNYLPNGDGTVTDLDTGLMWTQLPGAARPWEGALAYAEGLSTAGYTDWRLPNIKELQTLTDYPLATATTTAGIKPSIHRTMFSALLSGCGLTAGSTTVTCADTTGLLPGMPVVDPVNAAGYYVAGSPSPTVVAVLTPTSFTMSSAALRTGSGLSLRALVPPTAYWSSSTLSGRNTEAWLLETGINATLPAANGPARTSQGIVSYEVKTSSYPVFAVRTTTPVTQLTLSEGANALADGVSTLAYSATGSRTLSLRNTGVTALTLTGVTLDGAGAAAFSLGGAPAAGSILAAGASTTFTVSFANASAGTTYQAALHVGADDPAVGGAFDIALSGMVPVIGAVQGNPSVPVAGENAAVSLRVTVPNGKTLRASSPVELVYKVGANTTAPVFSETMAKAAVSPWDGTNADNLWDVVGGGNVQQATGNANRTPSGPGIAGMVFQKGSAVATATQAATRNAIPAVGLAGAANPAFVEFYVATVNPSVGLGWTFQLSPTGNAADFTTRLSETDTATAHGFQLYHYDLPDADRVGTLKMRFQFTGNGTGGQTGPKVYVDDIVVQTTTGVAPVTVALFDDGLHGDGAAGDGVYGGAIPGQAAATLINYSVVVNYADGTSTTLDAAGSYTVLAPLSVSTPATLPNALTTASYGQNLAASGGTPGYAWSLASGSLPPGITLSGAGLLGGTPAAIGTYSFTAQVVDGSGRTAARSFTLATVKPPNVVIIVTDDQGWADIGYHTAPGQVPIPTPNMDGLRARGIRLEKFYPTAVCSMTRSTLLTGRNCIRMGVNNERGLNLSEHMMPQTFKAAGYQTFMCGKWHLGGSENNNHFVTVNGRQVRVIQEGLQYAPFNRGWDVHYGNYSGSIDYFTHWSKELENLDRPDWWLNGVQQNDLMDQQGNQLLDANGQPAGGYSTDLLADKAVSLIQSRDPAKPLLLYLAFNAIHASVQAPPSYIAKYANPSDSARYVADPLRRLVVAAVDCMDVAMGRVLGALDSAGITNDTILVFMSDNGGNNAAGQINAPLRGTKTDPYDGGIHTPAAIAWPGHLAAGVTSNQLVWVGDFFPTLCAATGVPSLNPKPLDGVNLWPALQSISAASPDGAPRGVPLVTPASPTVGLDQFVDPVNGASKLFKLIYTKTSAGVTNELFNLTDDPYETTELSSGASGASYTPIIASLTAAITGVTVDSYPPYIGPPLITQTAPQGGSTTLYAPFTSYDTPTVQWRRNGQPIAGATAFTALTDALGATVGGAYTTTLTLSNLSAADIGSYDVVVTNVAGASTSESGTVTLALDAPVLAALPAFTKGNSRTIQWPAVNGAVEYTAELSASSGFSSVLVTQTVTTPSAGFTGLAHGTLYYYRVRATDGAFPSAWSNVVSSTQDAVAPVVVITAPISGGSGTSPTVTVTGTASDALSGVSGVLVNGVAATSVDNFATWSATVGLQAGLNTITATALDGAQSGGNPGSVSVQYTVNALAPVVSSLATGPTAPAYLDPVWITARVQPGAGATLGNVTLSYDLGMPVTTKVWQEVFSLGSVNAWNGSGTMNAWTVNAVTASNVKQAVGVANRTVPVVLSGCSTTAGSVVVGCADSSALFPGMPVSGSTLQSGSRVAAVTGPQSFTVSLNASGTGTGLFITASGVTLTNCTTTAASTSVTCDSTAGLVVGMALGGTGLANNATVSAITSGTVFTMNVAPITPGAGLTLSATGAAAEFTIGTANQSDTQITTTGAINATGSGGYVEFYVQTRDLAATNNNRWAFQTSADGGTTWNTRLTESWDGSTVNLTGVVLNPAGDAAGRNSVTCTSTAGLTAGQALAGPLVFFTGSVTSGNPVVTTTGTTGLAAGMFVQGAGIANGTRILSVQAGVSVTLSANPSTTGAATALAAGCFPSGATVASVTSATDFVASTVLYVNTSQAPVTATATTVNHDFKKVRYDLAGAELGSNLKLRFQFAGYTAPAPLKAPKVDVDDIAVFTTAPPVPVLVTMFDDGLHGDGSAGDGVYGAQVPAQPGGTTVNYRVVATDSLGRTTTVPPAGASYVVSGALTNTDLVNAEFLTLPTDTGVTLTVGAAEDVEAYVEYGTQPGVYTGATVPALYPAVAGPLRIALTGLAPNTQHYYRFRYRLPGASSYVARGERGFRTARPKGGGFQFTVTADPHLDFNTDPGLLARAMGNILADRPDFHVDLGDIFMTDKMADTVIGVPAQYGGGVPNEARVKLRASIFRNYFELMCHSVPYFYVLGNHEAEYGYLFNAATDKQNNIPAWNLKARKAYYPAPTPGPFYRGNPQPMDYQGGTLGLLEDYYAWEWGDALFIVLDPFWNTLGNPNSLNDAWQWTLGKTQYDWLKDTLQRSGARYRFVFMHHIVGGTTTLADGVTTNVAARGGVEVADKYEWGGKNADGSSGFATKRPGWDMPIHQLLVANHVNVVFHGHDHLYGYQTLDGMVYLECPQPGTANYVTLGSAGDGKYTQGVLQANSGHIRVTIAPGQALAEYVRSYRPEDENASRRNRDVTHSFTMAPFVSANTALAGIGLSAGALSPAFSAATTQYSVAVPYGTGTLTVNPVAQEAGATVRVNGTVASGGGVPVPLQTGSTLVVVQVTAQDGVTTGEYRLTVELPSALQVWRQRWFGTGDATGNAAGTADPYGTGLSNFVVFALLGPDQDPALARPSMLPQLQRAGGSFFFEFNTPQGVQGVVYGAEWTSDLKNGSWTAVPDTGSGALHRFSVPEAPGSRVFMRLRVMAP